MASQRRLIVLIGAILALAVITPSVALAADPAANFDVVDPAQPVVPTVIDVLANDVAGAAGPARPLMITAVGTPINGVAWTDGRSVVYDPSDCFTGSNVFPYTISDGVKTSTSQIAINVGRPSAAPVTNQPRAGFIKGSTLGSTVPLRVSWCGVTASGASVTGYRLAQSANGGAFATLISKTTATSTTRSAGFGPSYAWRVTTTDTKGASSATSIATRLRRIQENSASIAYSAGWRTGSSARYSGGRDRYVTRAGARATLTVSGVRQFAIVASKGSGRGSFHVYVDGVRVTASAISERASRASFRKVLYVGSIGGNTTASHTIQVRTTSRARVDLDAILTLSAKLDQSVTFAAPTSAIYGAAGQAVSATASSGLPALVSVTQGSWPVCALTSGTLTFHGVGTCTLSATQAGDSAWNARTVTRAIAVAPAPLTVTGISAANRAYVPGLLTANLDTGTADITGERPGDEGSVSLVTTGAVGTFADASAGPGKTVTVTGLALTGPKAALYEITPTTTTASITRATQAITFATTPVNPVKGGPAYVVSASAASGLPVTVAVNGASAAVCTIAGSTVSFPGSGNCQLDADQAGDGNWLPAVTTSQTFSVASTGTTPQSITFNPLPAASYGNGPLSLVATASSLLPVAFSSETATVCSVTGTTATFIGAGDCTITARQAGDPTYAPANDVPRTFTVGPRTLTVTGATAAAKPYDGSTAATLGLGSATLAGVIGGDDVQLVTGGATGTFAPDANAGAGKTVNVTGLTLTGSKASSYVLAQPTLTASITKVTLTVTATDRSMTYGNADPALTFGYAGFVNGEGAGVLDAAPTCAIGGSDRDVSGSPYAIACGGGVDGNYAFAYVDGDLTVNPRPVTISFSAADKTYDSLTSAAITGCTVAIIEPGDAASCSSASATASFATASAGDSKIVTGLGFLLTGADAGNYTITVTNTTVADIAKATPACTITGYTLTYDGGAHTASGQCLGVVGEPLAAPNLSGTTHTDAGAYPTDPWTFTDTSGNYNDAGGTVADTIGKASQSITFAALADKTYGDAAFGVSATATSGLTVAFGSQTGTVCSVSVSTVTLLKAGTCMVRASQAGDGNYLAALNSDRPFAVAKAMLTASADNKAITFGDPAPTYTLGYTGFAPGDDSGDITTQPTCASAYTQGNNAGSYPITCSGGSDDQYDFTFVAGTLTVAKADQTVAFIEAAPVGATVGGSTSQTATATSGLPAAVTLDGGTTNGACSFADGTVSYLAEGTCVLAANQAGNGNWNPAPQVLRSFAVSLEAQTITFGALSDDAYGEAFGVAATATSGLTVSFASTTPSVCTVATTTVTLINTGPCTIRATQAGDATYAAATPVDQAFTATTRPITVTAVTDTRVADGTTDSAGVPTVTPGGLVAGDTGAFTQSFETATAGTDKVLTPTGTIAKGVTDVTARYEIGFATATGTITPAAASTLALTATSPQTAGAPFTVTVTAKDPFGNTATAYAGTIHFTTTDPGAATLPGDYTFTGPDAGLKVFTNAVTLVTVGSQTVSATDLGTGSITGTSGAIAVQ